jgi:amicoumacin kinase
MAGVPAPPPIPDDLARMLLRPPPGDLTVASPVPLHIVEQFVALWTGDYGTAVFISNSTNAIYRFRRGRLQLILRVHHIAERTAEQIAAEVDWVDYLYRQRVAVAAPVRSKSGGWVQTAIWEDKIFHAAVFLSVPGAAVPLHDGKRWRAHLVRRAGRILGRIHAVTRNYRPPPGERRYDWSTIGLPYFAAALVPPQDAAYLANLHLHWDWIQSLPRDRDSFGLVHGDFQSSNLLVQKSRMRVIDFDGCCYNWYISDIAQLFGVSLLDAWSEDPRVCRALAERLFLELMRGYTKEHQLGPDWIARFPPFLRGVTLLYYLNVIARFNFDPQLQTRMPRYHLIRSLALSGRPLIELDFAGLYSRATRPMFLFGW